jgi:hypothetical protein
MLKKDIDYIQSPNALCDLTFVNKKNYNDYIGKTDYQNKFIHRNHNRKWYKVDETWNDYLNTLKKIDNEICINGEKNCEWVYNIFEGIQELDFIECVTKEFLIIPAERNKFEELVKIIPYNFDLLVFPFNDELRTIRNLKKSHIPLLKRMKAKAIEVISKYIEKLDETNLHCEFHYLPSTYHLHLHIGLGKNTTNRPNVHKFDEVISNLESDTNYYIKPIPIYVRDISNWNMELEKYSQYNIFDNRTNYNNKWKFFENLDCFNNYNY